MSDLSKNWRRKSWLGEKGKYNEHSTRNFEMFKNRKKLIQAGLIATLATAVVGCGTTRRSTGASQLAKDTYTLSGNVISMGSIDSNDAYAKRFALDEANAFCKTKSKEIQVQNVGIKSTNGSSTAEIIFQCLSSDEAASSNKPVYRREPSLIIENRTR